MISQEVKDWEETDIAAIKIIVFKLNHYYQSISTCPAGSANKCFWEVTNSILICIIPLISLAFSSKDGETKTHMSCPCTFSWKIYIWKAKAVSSCNQLTLIISHSLHAISPLMGEVMNS